MNNSEELENSLCQVIQRIVSGHKYHSSSIEHLIFAVEHWETNIHVLEQRLKLVRQGVANLARK